MNLHKNTTLFDQLLRETAANMKMPSAYIEKDYFAALFLRALTENARTYYSKAALPFPNATG